MKRISVSAVLAGAAADLVLTNLLMIPIAVIFAARPEMQSLAAADQGAAVVAAFKESTWAYGIGVGLGSLASIYGGWVAAGIAKRDARLHGALSAIGCVGLGLYAWASGFTPEGLWSRVVFLVLSPALGVLGGALRERRDAQRADTAGVGSGNDTAALVGGRRALYIFDAFMLVCALASAVLFAIVAIAGNASAPQATLGAWFLSVYAAMVTLSFYAATRTLRRGHRLTRRWHFIALLLTLAPGLAFFY